MAIKRQSDQDFLSDGWLEQRLQSPWVQMPVHTHEQDGWGYSVFKLAQGSVQNFLDGWGSDQLQQQSGPDQPQQQSGGAAFRPLPPNTSKALMAQMAVALQHVHRAGVRQGDVKAGNFLVGMDGSLIVSDFGLAEEADSNPRLSRGATEIFMAPEQELRGWRKQLMVLKAQVVPAWLKLLPWPRRHFDSRPVDVFALGVTYLDLMLPFEQVVELMAGIRCGRWPAAAPEGISATLWDLLRGMLALNPKRRLTIEQVKGHAFFDGVDWSAVEGRQAPWGEGIDVAAIMARGRQGAAVVEGQVEV